MRKLSLFLILSTLPLCGCADSFRNKVERQTIPVERRDSKGRSVKLGYIAKPNAKLPIRYETESGEQFTEEMDVGGWDVSPPPIPQEVRKQ